MDDTRGFTLIELLVVVTIIVALLSLLTPALDRALYEAELTLCGAQLKTVSTGLQTYAMDHRRRYIHRQGLEQGGGWDVSILHPGVTSQAWAGTGGGGASVGDLRLQLSGYLVLNKHLLDPFVEPVDIEASLNETYTYGSYHIFAGWKYINSSGMMRLGERFGWSGRRYTVLAADSDHFNLPSYAMASHPDDTGALINRKFQDQELVTGAAFGVTTGTNVTLSWYDPDTDTGWPPRGLIDRNVAFTDGAVERFGMVPPPQPPVGEPQDERMGSVPWTYDGGGFGSYPTYGVQIPLR
jgi:prepilin-type N-terminal cleavage/methylation domain-containing protein